MGTKSTPLNPSFSGNIIIDENNDRLVVSQNNIPIGIFGKDQDGNVVVKIAPVGVNVLGATDEQLIFNSGNTAMQISEIGSLTINPGTIGAGSIGTSYGTYNFTKSYSVDPIVLPVISSGSYGSGGLLATTAAGAVGSQVLSGPLLVYGIGWSTGGLYPDQAAMASMHSNTNSVSITFTFYNGTGSSWSPGAITIAPYILSQSIA